MSSKGVKTEFWEDSRILSLKHPMSIVVLIAIWSLSNKDLKIKNASLLAVKVSQISKRHLLVYLQDLEDNSLIRRDPSKVFDYEIVNEGLFRTFKNKNSFTTTTVTINDAKQTKQNQTLNKKNVNEIVLKSFEIDHKAQPLTDLNRRIWEAYKEAFVLRYKVEPTRNMRVNSQIKSLGQRLGEDAVEVVKMYVTHNDSKYISNVHSIGMCLFNAEALHTQYKRGKSFTQNDIRNFEKTEIRRSLKKSFENKEDF